MKLHNLKEAIFSYCCCHLSDLRITKWQPLSSTIQEWNEQEQTKIASEVQNTEKINSHCVEIKQGFSACLAVSPFLVVPIPYDSELNSLSLPTVPQYKSLRSIFLTFMTQCEITLKGRAPEQLVFPINCSLSEECPALDRSSHWSTAQWYWFILICSTIRYTVCCCAGPSVHLWRSIHRVPPVCQTISAAEASESLLLLQQCLC